MTKEQMSHPLQAIAPPSVLPEAVIHPSHEEIEHEVISYLVQTWDWPSEKAKKGFVSWKLSDVVLFMFPTGEVNKVKLACELLLLGFLMDDWFDNHSFSTNTAVVNRLDDLFASPSTFQPQGTIEHMHASLFARILAASNLSPPAAEPAILSTYLRMLACHCDPSRGSAATLGDYLVFREVDVGMPICVELLYWTDELVLSVAETKALAALERVANYHVSILNDVFSFDREWQAARTLGQGAVLVNGVRILADETAVSVEAAKRLCFALVRAWEVEFQNMAVEVMERARAADEDSKVRLRRAVKGIERRMTGAEAFSWRTSRYL